MLAYLPGYNGKVTPDKKMACKSYQRYKSENRDYCSHFSMTFETTSKFLIVFIRLILGKSGLVNLPRRRYEFDLKVIWKGLGFKERFLQPFLIEFPSNNWICYCFYQIDFAESCGWLIYRATTGKWCQIRKWFLSLIKGIRLKIEIIAVIFQWHLKQKVNF